MTNTQTIGETAGAVWEYLKDHGKSTLRAVQNGVESPAGTVPMAVGWLAREGKVELAQEKRTMYIWLKED
jgi:hypothetical protein